MRHPVMLALLVCVAVLNCTREPSLESSQPHILLIMIDDLGKEWVSCYGAENISTPHIDALASEGVAFDHVYAMPQCTPTRLTLLTGQYPFRHGWVNHWDVPRWGGGAHFDERRNPALTKIIKEQGYATCIAGKWQIDDFRVEPDALTRLGFDSYCMWTGYETGVPASAERYYDPYIYSNRDSRTYQGKFGPDVFTDFISTFIDTHHTSPMFIYYPMVLTHTPLVSTPDEQVDTELGKHKAMVKYVDKIVGRLVAKLKEKKIFEETLIILTSDNGTTRQIVGNYRGSAVRGGKASTTEEGICVPYIMSWPAKINQYIDQDALIDFTDILPTLVEVAGGKVKEGSDAVYPIDGRSFSYLWTGEDRDHAREWIMSMGGGNNARLTERGVENEYRFRDRVIRNRRFKLCWTSDQEAGAFYDLQEDPWEKSDLLTKLDSQKIWQHNFNDLTKVLHSFPSQDEDPHYLPNPDQSWDVDITAKSQVWKK